MAEVEYVETPIPGLEPFVLVRIVSMSPDEEEFGIRFEYGGGLDKESAFAILKAIVEDSEEV